MKTKNHFSVPLNPTERDEEVYRAADENIVRVEIQSPSGEMIALPKYKVVISLTKDAMLGLGSSLIRAALNESHPRSCWEFENARPDSASEELGVYLHPVS